MKKKITIENVSEEARKCAAAWAKAKRLDMFDAFKLGIDIQRVVNNEIRRVRFAQKNNSD